MQTFEEQFRTHAHNNPTGTAILLTESLASKPKIVKTAENEYNAEGDFNQFLTEASPESLRLAERLKSRPLLNTHKANIPLTIC